MGSVLALTALLGVVSDLGLQAATVRALSVAEETGADADRILGAALILRTCLGVTGAVVGSAVLLLGPFSSVVRLGGIIALLGVVSPCWCVHGAVLQAHFSLGRLRTLTLLSGTIALSASLGAAFLHTGAPGVLFGQTLVVTAFGFMVSAAARPYQRVTFVGSRAHMPPLLGVGWQLAASTLLATLYYRLDTVLLTISSSAAEVALYYSSYRLTEAFAVFPGAVVAAFFPAITRLQLADRSQAIDLSSRLVRVLLAGGLVIAVAGIMNAEFIVHILYGRQYAASTPVLQILFLAVPLMYFNLGVFQTGIAFNRMRLLLTASAVGAVLNALANVVLIPHFAARGAAAATVITEIVVSFVGLRWWLTIVCLPHRRIAVRTTATIVALSTAVAISIVTVPLAAGLLTAPLCVATLVVSGTMDRRLVTELWRHRPSLPFGLGRRTAQGRQPAPELQPGGN